MGLVAEFGAGVDWNTVGQGRRTVPLPADWAIRRKLVLARDRYVCYVCGWAIATEVDHVVPASQGGGDELSNLKAICAADHRQKTSQEANQAQDTRRPAEEHPGFKEANE